MLRRVYLKIIYLINFLIGKVFYLLETKGLLKGVPYLLYHEQAAEKKVMLQYPENYLPKDKSLFSHFTDYFSNRIVVYRLSNVNVSNLGIVFSKMNNCPLSFPHTGFRAQYGWLYLLKQYWFRKKEKGNKELTYILLFDFWSYNNYYHWMVDSLPRLLLVEKELKDKNYSLLLPDTCSKFIFETLTCFDIGKITLIKKGTYFHSQQLLLPYYTVGSGRIHPEYTSMIRRRFLEKIPASSTKSRVYISRNKQKARRVYNENEVINVLTPLGFEIVYFEDLTLIQQIELAKGIEIAVSSHGANMTNTMFMPNNSKVLELIREDEPNFCYWALATVTNKKYYYQLCKVVGNDHLLVDVKQFRLNLLTLLGG